MGSLWTVPPECAPVAVGGVVTLSPSLRTGISPLELPLPPGLGSIWGLALLAIATIVTIVVVRWTRRTKGDALLLGTLWVGVCLHALPRLFMGGPSLAEMQIASLSFGVGDLAILWALLWLTWRFIAELIS